MSGYSADLERGKAILYKGKKKIVKDWFFISDDACHNSDLIVIQFTDGTNSEDGFRFVEDI